jgi:hypothetical protein
MPKTSLVVLAVVGILLAHGCAGKGGVRSAVDAIAWYSAESAKGNVPEDATLALRVAQLMADEAQMNRFLQILRQARDGSPESDTAVILARYLKDLDSYEILKRLALDSTGAISDQAILSLFIRCRRREWPGLDSASVVKLLDESRSKFARGSAIVLAERDANSKEVFLKALADSSAGVHTNVINSLVACKSERLMAKEWLRKRVLELHDTVIVPPDVTACMKFMIKAYGLSDGEERVEDVADMRAMARYVDKVLALADSIDAFTEKAEGSRPAE